MKKTKKIIGFIFLFIILTGGFSYLYGVKHDFGLTDEEILQVEMCKYNIMVNSKYYNATDELISEELGSGFLYEKVDNTYYFITNFHVVDNLESESTTYQIKTYNGITYEATYVRGDVNRDLAIMSFESDREYDVYTLNDDKTDQIEVND